MSCFRQSVTRAFLDAVIAWRWVMVMIGASHTWAVSTLSWRLWMSHLLIVDAHLGVGPGSVTSTKGAALFPPSRSSSCPGCRQSRSTSGGSTGGLRITVVANPQGTIAPLALRNQLSCQWNVLGPLHGAYQQYPWRSSRQPDVKRCMTRSFWRGRFGSAAAPAIVMLEWRPPRVPNP